MYIAGQNAYGDPASVFIMVMIEPAMSIIINMHIRVVMIAKYHLGAWVGGIVPMRVMGKTT